MRNLLPETSKKKLRREYLARVGVVALFAVFVSSIAGSAFLLPAFFISTTKKDAVDVQSTLITQSAAHHADDPANQTLAAVKAKLDLFETEEKGASVRELISTVVSKSGSGVAISSIAYTNPNMTGRLVIRGVADKRDSLLELETAFEADAQFSGVNLPVSNLARDRDIDFSLELLVGE